MADAISSKDNYRRATEITAQNLVVAKSRINYNSKVKYCIKFMEDEYPDSVVEDDAGEKSLKIPLPFEAIQALFGRLETDTSLPRDAKKRKKATMEKRAALEALQQAAIDKGEEPEELPEEVEDTTINKANSVTVSKSCLGGYKSALKLYYKDRNVAFECPDRPSGSQSLDTFLDAQIKSYGNLVADKKVRAIMSANEGKNAMTEEGFNDLLWKLIKYNPREHARPGKRVK